ncbi:MAG: phosphatidate cytidylyltransferase [Endomicrobiales bacterium]|nr:phosphatidate cytidylyltransferase [Endomicrobiales bacterium]
MLLPRLITAIIGIPLVILSIYWGGIPFFILILGVIFLSLKEYFFLVSYGGYKTQPVIGTIVGIILFLSIYINSTTFAPHLENQGTAFILTIMLIPIILREITRKKHDKTIESLSTTFFGAFFIPWTLGHLILIRSLMPFGIAYISYLFIIIWILDTGAYIVGVKFGKRHLSQYVSPKKTIEGLIGAVFFAVIFSFIGYLVYLKNVFTLLETLVIGFTVAIVAQFSDLSESLIKRDVGVKDSANILPGHGGMLDRFDSFLFAAPIFYYYLTIFK